MSSTRAAAALLWPVSHCDLEASKRFRQPTKVAAGLTWWEWHELDREKLYDPVDYHLRVRGDPQPLRARPRREGLQAVRAGDQAAGGATEEQHLELLGVLNSSIACFWLKQVSHNKGSTVDTSGARQTLAPWEDFYEFTGTKLQEFPLPAHLPGARGAVLDELARELDAVTPRAVIAEWRGGPCRWRAGGRSGSGA